MQIRQITAAERVGTTWPLGAYAFMPSPWTDQETEAFRERMAYFATATTLIAEEDGQALACAVALPMRENLRGIVHDMAGVASVATHPAARRRGLVRALLERLLPQMRDEGCTLTALYPFRPSFYAKFGYIGLPGRRTATFTPAGLSDLLRVELPGEVEWLSMREAFDEYTALTHRLLGERHGFSVFDAVRTSGFRESKSWVAIARSGGEVLGAVAYKIEDHDGDLVASDLLTTGPLGRALLLQFFARHVDQVARVKLTVGTEDVPELWATDMSVVTEGRSESPSARSPMARVLDLRALSGTPAGDGTVTVEVVDDELIGGVYRLEGDGGRLTVTKGKGDSEAAGVRLTAAGISGLAYGVLDPVDVVTRGLGRVESSAIGPLRSLFPRSMPYLFSDF